VEQTVEVCLKSGSRPSRPPVKAVNSAEHLQEPQATGSPDAAASSATGISNTMEGGNKWHHETSTI